MFGILSFAGRLGAMAIAVGLVAASLPSAASAQDEDVPSYARPAYASADETIHGRIRSVEGAFTISVDDDRGFVDSVELHQGTIINPTGLTLSPGMSVTILGANAGAVFSANEIDTPYTYDGPLPTPVYYGPGYWCPGFAYGYGPSFSLAIVIGGGPRPWYYEHRPYFGRPWNGRRYFGAAIAFAPGDLGREGGAGDVRRATVGAPSSTARPSVARGESGYSRGSAAVGGGYSRGPGASRGSAPSRSGSGEHSGGGHGGGHAH